MHRLVRLLRPLVAHNVYPAVSYVCLPIEVQCKKTLERTFNGAHCEMADLTQAAKDLVPLLGQGSASSKRLGSMMAVLVGVALNSAVRESSGVWG